MKNLFWFIHKPADEREQQLLNTAYYYALSVMWVGVSLFLVSRFWFSDSATISSFKLYFIAITLLLVSYITGWVTLRKEELSGQSHHKSFPYWQAACALAALYLYVIVALIFAPQTYFIQIKILSYGTWIITAVWMWKHSKSWSLHTRITAIILAPIVILFLPLGKVNHWLKQLLAAVVALVLLFLIPFCATKLIRFQIVEPIYSPSLSRKEPYVLLDKVVKEYKVGDSVLLNTEQYFAAGTITRINGNHFSITSNYSAPRTVIDASVKNLSGKLIINRPN
jgi:hypothetical protein